MPTKSGKKSNSEPDQQVPDSVYDFLYHDARRVGSFLAQLNPSGHLQSLKTISGTKEHSAKTSTIDSKLSVAVAGIAGTAEDSAGGENYQSADKTFDPLWANALELLDQLSRRNLLVRNMHHAGLGQFVLVSGDLKVVDTALLKSAWNSPLLVAKMTTPTEEVDAETNEFSLQLIQNLPHNPQAYFYAYDEHGEFVGGSWMTLDPGNMIVPAADLTLKYGYSLGYWSMLGIKDAAVDDGPQQDPELMELMADGWQKAAAARHSTPMALLAELFTPMARAAMGRPSPYYGMTPILIFREVSAAIIPKV